MINLQKRHLIISGLICIILITLSSCETVRVFVKEDPPVLPGQIEKIVFEEIDNTEIPESEDIKIIINEYKAYINDIRWRLRDYTIQLITGNITPDEHEIAVRPLYDQLSQFEKVVQEYKDSLLLE